MSPPFFSINRHHQGRVQNTYGTTCQDANVTWRVVNYERSHRRGNGRDKSLSSIYLVHPDPCFKLLHQCDEVRLVLVGNATKQFFFQRRPDNCGAL
mgnify:CR=1 FL=1